MDGTEVEQLQWRVLALREAMQEALSGETTEVMTVILRNGLLVDDGNAETMRNYRPSNH
jgi:hypothetical protein